MREVLAAWGFNGMAETAALLTSELATNVVLHAGTPYAVIVAQTVEGARVDVLDDSGTTPVVRPHDLNAPTGRGLALVASLSVAWGETPRADRAGFAKGVRFTIG